MRNFNPLVPGKRLIGIDPAPRETGIAVVDLVGKTISVPYSTTFKTDRKDDVDRRLGNLVADIATVLDTHANERDLIAIEGYVPNHKENPPILELLFTRLKERLRRDGHSFEYHPAPRVKKLITRDPHAQKAIVANVVRINTDVETDNYHITDAVATAIYGGYCVGIISPTDELQLVRPSATIPRSNDSLVPPEYVSEVSISPDETLREKGHQIYLEGLGGSSDPEII